MININDTLTKIKHLPAVLKETKGGDLSKSCTKNRVLTSQSKTERQRSSQSCLSYKHETVKKRI